MKKENERNGSQPKQQRIWYAPKHGSRDAADLAQGLPNEIVKRDLRRRAQIIDPAAGPNRLNFFEIVAKFFLVATHQIRIQQESALAPALHIVQRYIPP